jgi:predicted permease
MTFASDLRADLRFALRLYRRSPTFTAVVVASLALGIGVNTALFSLANAFLLRPLPVREPEQLVQLNRQGPGGAGPVVSYPMYRALQQGSAGVSDCLATGWVWRWNLGLGAGPSERVAGELVSGNYFEVLGVPPALGRVLGAGDERAGADPAVVVLSHQYWTRRFHRDPQVLGTRLVLNGAPVTVVGVAGKGFGGVTLADPVDLWTPAAMQPRVLHSRDWLVDDGNNWLRVLARRKPGVTAVQAQAVAHAAFRQNLAARGVDNEERMIAADGRFGLSLLRKNMGRPMLFLSVLVGLVLAIACVNVATLQLGRATHRERELAVRLALGGGRGRLVRQLLAENVLLATAGAGLGLFLAWMGMDALVALLFPLDHPPVEATIDWRVLLFTAGLGVLTGVASGLLPARQAWRLDPGEGLKLASGRATQRTTGRGGIGSGMVLPTAQVALTFVLLVGAGLLARSFHALRTQDPGFDGEHVLAMRVDAQALSYTQADFSGLYRRLLDTARALPGVQSAALADQAPFTRGLRQGNITVDGFAAGPGSDLNPYLLAVSPGYFETLGMARLAGRAFEERDLADGAAAVAIVNRSFARYYFGEGPAVGRVFAFGAGSRGRRRTIVGVVEDAQYSDLRGSAPHVVYMPLGPVGFPTRAFSYSETTLTVRTAGDPTPLAQSLRRALFTSDPALPVIGTATLRQHVERSLGNDRLAATLSLLFGALALVLTCTGIYGVLSYGVSRRTREIGVRLALGARAEQVRWMVGRRSGVMLAVGLAVGLPAALLAAHLARSVLFGVSPSDPAALAVALLAVALVTFLASFGPARAATRVDPMIALRAD